jgi:hypothetical protein
MAKRGEDDESLTMIAIRGQAKICTFCHPDFRADVLLAAKKLGWPLQQFVLVAVRDKLREYRKLRNSIEGRRAIALQKLFEDKRAGQNVKDCIEVLLKPYLPRD